MRYKNADGKTRALREQGCLHSHPETVRDDLFLTHDFFDARDVVQVKYEMIRRVKMEGQPIQKTADRFGFSRPSFYKAQTAFEEEGLPGLLPRRRGPHGAHKLTDEILDFIDRALHENPSLRAPVLAERVEEKYGIRIHPRSIERAVEKRRKKKR